MLKQNFKITAIIVSYHPVIKEFKKNIDVIRKQVESVIIVDNSEVQENYNFIRDIEKLNGVEYIWAGDNLGIGAAQNIGIAKAYKEGAEMFLFLDQDSEPPLGFVEELLDSMSNLHSSGIEVGCVGPKIINKDSKEVYQSLFSNSEIDKPYFEKSVLISSGTLVSRAIMDEVGVMNEELFIDLVDFEWCWRLKQKGFKCYVTNKTYLEHRVGNRVRPIIGKFNILVPAPIRHYYQYRNNILLINNKFVPFGWKIKSLLKGIIELPYFVLFCKPSLQRSKFIFKGIVDGLMQKKGKISNES